MTRLILLAGLTFLVTYLCAVEPPERFVASMQSNHAIVLSWEATSGADALVVQRSLTGGGWSDVATLAGNATAYTDTGLPNASLRLYRLAIQVGGSVVGYSHLAWASSGEPVTAASITQRTYAIRQPDGGARLYWEHRCGDVVRFRIEGAVGAGAWTFLTDAAATATSIVVADADRTQQLMLRVRPESASAVGAWTEASGMVAAPPQVRQVFPIPFTPDPGTTPPSGLTVQRIGPSTFQLTWTGIATSVLRATDAATWHDLGIGNGLSSVTVSTASHGLAQRFAIYNAGGWSNVITVPALVRDPALRPATNVAVSVVGSAATITWDWSGTGATGFSVERWDNSSLSNTWTSIGEVGPAVRSISDTGAWAWTQYRVWVRSAVGWGPVAGLTGSPSTTPAPSALAQTSSTPIAVALSWTGTHYQHFLQRAEGAGPWRDLGSTSTTTFTDVSVVPGTTYRYRVSAEIGGPYANELTVAVPVPASAPGAVGGLTVSGVAPDQINATWNAGGGSPATSFVLATSPDGSTWTTAATLPADARSWRLTGLSAGTLRHIRVVAGNAAGSAPAVSASATTPATAPTPTVSVTTSPIGGWRTLVVLGTAADDTLEVRQSGGTCTVYRSGSLFATQAGPFTEVRIFGADGNDTLRIDSSVTVRAALFGGPGDDTLTADGTGPQTVVALGQGRDSVNGRAGLVDFWVDRDGIDAVTVSAADETAGRVHRVLRFDRDFPIDPKGQDLPETGAFSSPGRRRLPDQPLWGDGPGMLDINQGGWQDCPFTSEFQALACTAPGLLQQFIVDLGDGTYALEVAGGHARVDGEFLTNYACKAPPSGQVWGLVLEKALVGYGHSLPARISRGFEDLGWAESDPETSYRQVRAAITARRSIGVFSRQLPLLDFEAGSPTQHAHTVVGAFRAADGSPRFIIRNPYGTHFEMNFGFTDWRCGMRIMTWAQVADIFVSSAIEAYGDSPIVAPTALAGTASVAVGRSVLIRLQGLDVDGHPLVYAVTSPPGRGTLGGTAPYLVYTPSGTSAGSDAFAFTVQSPSGTSASASMSIAILGGANTAPDIHAIDATPAPCVLP